VTRAATLPRSESDQGKSANRQEAAELPEPLLTALDAEGFEYIPASGCYHRALACLRVAMLQRLFERCGPTFVAAFVEACAEAGLTRSRPSPGRAGQSIVARFELDSESGALAGTDLDGPQSPRLDPMQDVCLARPRALAASSRPTQPGGASATIRARTSSVRGFARAPEA
jgi:hypothetical protein